MPNRKHTVITMPRLQRALSDVQNELDRHGIWNQRLEEVDVFLTPVGVAYGYQHYRCGGHIEIPAVSLCRLLELWPGSKRATLRDILRHEYAHALADTHRGLVRSRQFRAAFNTPHDSEIPGAYSSDCHVSTYAATDASEDFAETFTFYVKHNSVLPRRFNTLIIRRKWAFVDRLIDRIRSGKYRW